MSEKIWQVILIILMLLKEVLVEKLMKERKKDIYNVVSPPSSTRECFCTAGSQVCYQPPSRQKKEAEQRCCDMRGACATCSMYLCEVYVGIYS